MTDPNVSVAPDQGTMKRAIQMNFFAKKKDHDRVATKNSETFRETEEGRKLFADNPSGKYTETLGQIVGQIFSVEERNGTLPDGTPKASLVAIGEFEAVIYATGEIMESYIAYLPDYFLRACKGALESGIKSVPFALEIVLTPTGKSIPTAYEVRNLIRKSPTSVLNQMKAELAAAGRLRLSPPTAAPPLAQLGVADAEGVPPAESEEPNDIDPDFVPEGGAPTAEELAEGAAAHADGGKSAGASSEASAKEGRKGRQAAE